jgi:uncharacterized protein
MTAPLHLSGDTFHGRRGAVQNKFRYAVDYLLVDPEDTRGPSLFSRNRRNLLALWDADHGGAPGQGRGVAWLREVLAAHHLPGGAQIRLLAQPRVLGHVFNPVAFWLCHDAAGALRVVVAEVTNTYGDRHCYICQRSDLGPIAPEDHIVAKKILHVSPFQSVEGGYVFRFDIRPDRIGIFIDFSGGESGLYATLTGRLRPLTNRSLLGAVVRQRLGSRRVLALIHWQALKLWWKGARFRTRPLPPAKEIS